MTLTADDIIKILAAVGILSTVIGGLVVNIITANKTQSKVLDIAEKTDNIVKKTDKQTTKLENIEILVDGRYSAVLQELADVKKLLADRSGLQSHIDSAERAQTKADDQEKQLDSLKDHKVSKDSKDESEAEEKE